MDELKTKSVNLTSDEIMQLMGVYGSLLCQPMQAENFPDIIDRINYLNKRLKAFAEAPSVGSSEPETAAQPAPAANPWPVN